MSDNQFGPPQPGFGPPQDGPIPPQGAPGAPQGGYGQPVPPQQQAWGGGAVPPPGFPPGTPGGYPPGVPMAKKSRKGLWIGLSVVAAVVLGGAATIGYLIYDTASNTGKNKVVLPQSFKDLTSDPEDADAKRLSSTLQSGLGEDKNSFTNAEPVSTIYRSSDQQKMLLVSGMTGKVLLPSKQVDAAFSSFSAGGDGIKDRSDVDPGPLGGRLSCGTTEIAGEQGGICVWADSSSVVVVLELDGSSDSGVSKDRIIADTQELRKLSEVPK
ncbi:hypothetical protein [Kitasatospora sp. CB02891]|uniref:hypothetical protein n=1 Tax=Kitasatospora sp. CB02891 TaxID=2020329 RepID=UPI000C26F560|nr:hypothetical protein [Kitasatospora sp. CB02891]PJN26756.1 hypothetical protein CG736_09015 [Kitasatospora sp. CB02891]